MTREQLREAGKKNVKHKKEIKKNAKRIYTGDKKMQGGGETLKENKNANDDEDGGYETKKKVLGWLFRTPPQSQRPPHHASWQQRDASACP
jgi:hypothetical protein